RPRRRDAVDLPAADVDPDAPATAEPLLDRRAEDVRRLRRAAEPVARHRLVLVYLAVEGDQRDEIRRPRGMRADGHARASRPVAACTSSTNARCMRGSLVSSGWNEVAI